jgi:SAM-dependent methyltransferase
MNWKRRLYGSYLDPLGIAHRTIARAMERSREFARGNLLDIGCGNKPYLEQFQSRVSSYIGIEMPGTQSNSEVVDAYASALALPFASNSFDTVLTNEVLEHVPEPQRLLEEAYRVLKPQGYLILTAALTWGPHEVPHDFYRYTEFGLRYLAAQAGFAVEKIERTTGLWATFGQRASAFVYYHHGWKRNAMFKASAVAVSMVLQMIFSAIDWAYRHQGDTLDHLMIARKT